MRAPCRSGTCAHHAGKELQFKCITIHMNDVDNLFGAGAIVVVVVGGSGVILIALRGCGQLWLTTALPASGATRSKTGYPIRTTTSWATSRARARRRAAHRRAAAGCGFESGFTLIHNTCVTKSSAKSGSGNTFIFSRLSAAGAISRILDAATQSATLIRIKL